MDTLVAHLKEGATLDEYRRDHPTVSREQIEATLDLMLSALRDGRRLDYDVVWCVIHRTPAGRCKTLVSI